jgi:hypothetical protein
MDGYLNEHFHIPAKNPPSEARLRWRRAVGRVVLNSRRRFREFSALGTVDDAQRRKILVRSPPSPFPTSLLLLSVAFDRPVELFAPSLSLNFSLACSHFRRGGFRDFGGF